MASNSTSIEDDAQVIRPASLPAQDFDLAQVRRAVRGIRYGEVRVIIQDGIVVQIERVEKQRLR